MKINIDLILGIIFKGIKMLKKINYLLIPLMLITILISGCGGGDKKTVTPEIPPAPPTAKYNITGYVEDDPLVNATVTIQNENGDNLLSVTTDTNGMYTLNAAIEEDEEYTLLAVGELSGKTVTMHSQFVFKGSDSQINVNPLTELKYQLVQNNSQTLAQAEALVRDYFNIIKGESLEAIRFSTTDKAYIGLTDIAKIYGATLPIEAIEKVKEDIVRNDLTSSNQVKEYSYKSLVEQGIKLDVSAKSLALNEELTVSLQGIETLNENYTILWGGLTDEVIEGTDVSKTFTINEYAQDIYVTATLYKIHSEQEIYVATAGENINFYKPLEEVSAIVEDSTIDNEFTVSNALKMKVRANTLANGIEIKVTELQTNSEATLAQFAIDSNASSTDTVTIEYKYDPYQVSEPRNLQVTLQGDEPKIIEVSEIDYANHVLKFEVELNPLIARNSSDHDYRVIIDLQTNDSIADRSSEIYTRYMSYIEEILLGYGSDPAKAQKILDNIKGENGKEKFIYLMSKVDPTSGEHYINILSTAINYMIAKESAELMFNSTTSWGEAKEAYYLFNASCVLRSDSLACRNLYNKYIDKLLEADKVLSAWVGNAKLTPGQTSFLKISKIINLQASIVKGIREKVLSGETLELADKMQFYMGITKGEAIASVGIYNEVLGGSIPTPSEMEEFYIDVLIDSAASVISGGLKFNFASYAISFGVNRAFDLAEYGLITGNRNATFPLVLALSDDYTKLQYSNFDKTKSTGFSKDEFLAITFPEGVTGKEGVYRQSIQDATNYYVNFESFESRLGSMLDPNKRFEKSFLRYDDYFKLPVEDNGGAAPDTSNPLEFWHNNGGLLSEHDRAFVFTGFRYLFGDQEAKRTFDYLEKGSLMLAQRLLFSVSELSDSDLTTTTEQWADLNYTGCTIQSRNNGECGPSGGYYGEKVELKSGLNTTFYQDFRDFWHTINNSVSANVNVLDVNNYRSFEAILDRATLRLSDSLYQRLQIKEIKVETYGVGIEYSTSDNAWILDESDKVSHTFKATNNINQQFVFNDESGKHELSFATLFSAEDFMQFDNKLVGLKILLTYESSGVDKVETAEFVSTTLADNENLTETGFSGATLKSNVKDAVTGDALVGAFVTLNPGGLSSFTNENGDYEVSSLAAGNYTIIITKAGYKQVEASLTLTEDETKIYEVSLSVDNDSATTSGTTNITIRDAYNGLVLTNGYISLREGQNNKTGEITQTVNSNGEANIEFTLFPGQYTLEIGANGYSKSYSTITIIGGARVVKEVSISPVLAEDQLRAVLTWGEFPRDLDSHLVKKINDEETYHIFYGNMSPANADANLDTDDTSSYGPETITINNIDPNAIYTYYVYNFTGGEDSVLPNSGAKIDIYSGESSQTLFVPNQGGQYWKVFEIVNGEIVPCTENCVRATDEDISRSLNSEALIFKGLPHK